MIVGVCSGGPVSEVVLPPCDSWIGVDRGALYLVESGIVPIDIVGDFDSVNEAEFEQIRAVVPSALKLNAEKDETDTELAIERALALHPSRVLVTGVTGGRLDHFEAALRILVRYQLAYPDVNFTIVNKQNELSVLTPGVHTLKRDHAYRYVSFFAVDGTVENVTLRGVKYETTSETIERFSSRFTSNEIIKEDASISFDSGICLVIRSHD